MRTEEQYDLAEASFIGAMTTSHGFVFERPFLDRDGVSIELGYVDPDTLCMLELTTDDAARGELVAKAIDDMLAAAAPHFAKFVYSASTDEADGPRPDGDELVRLLVERGAIFADVAEKGPDFEWTITKTFEPAASQAA